MGEGARRRAEGADTTGVGSAGRQSLVIMTVSNHSGTGYEGLMLDQARTR